MSLKNEKTLSSIYEKPQIKGHFTSIDGVSEENYREEVIVINSL